MSFLCSKYALEFFYIKIIHFLLYPNKRERDVSLSLLILCITFSHLHINFTSINLSGFSKVKGCSFQFKSAFNRVILLTNNKSLSWNFIDTHWLQLLHQEFLLNFQSLQHILVPVLCCRNFWIKFSKCSMIH